MKERRKKEMKAAKNEEMKERKKSVIMKYRNEISTSMKMSENDNINEGK